MNIDINNYNINNKVLRFDNSKKGSYSMQSLGTVIITSYRRLLLLLGHHSTPTILPWDACGETVAHHKKPTYAQFSK